jgi:hypothetical protein
LSQIRFILMPELSWIWYYNEVLIVKGMGNVFQSYKNGFFFSRDMPCSLEDIWARDRYRA